jgi:hypothetical protein
MAKPMNKLDNKTNDEDTQTNMNTPEKPIPQPAKSNKLLYILIGAMLIYGTVFLVLSFCKPTWRQVFFVSQILNAAAFFIAIVAFIKANNAKN